MEQAYRAAFADYGIDTEDEATASDLLAGSDIAPHLAQALDQWALCHPTLAVGDSGARVDRADLLLRLASAADPDPTRDLVRATSCARASAMLDAASLRALADEVFGDASQEPESILLLAGGLRVVGDELSAVRLLRDAARRHRADFWISLHLALALRDAAPPDRALVEALSAHAGLQVERRHELAGDLSDSLRACCSSRAAWPKRPRGPAMSEPSA